MNLQSENKSNNTSLQKLKQTTAESMQTITETPYQPIVYAIPKEDWNTLMRALNGWANAVGEEVEKAAKKTEDRMQKILTESRELLTQDGKTREAFFFDLRREVNGQIGEIEDLLSKMKKWILWTFLANVGLTSVLSLVICLLMN